jgi:hypothetical protein
MSNRLLCGFLLATGAFCAAPADDNWPQFRGSGGLGLGDDNVVLPSEFGPQKALLWKTALPLGHGSPCIWGDRIFVTSFEPGAKKLELIAIERKNGEIAWRRTIPAKELEQVHEVSSPATSTPATDGNRIYVYSGSYGVLAYDWDGKVRWEYPMEVSKAPYGAGTSPVLAGELVLITRDYPPEPFLLAIHKKDGTVAWRKELVEGRGGPRTAHSTPVVWQDQIVLNRPGEISAYALRDGSRLWWLQTAAFGDSTPLVGDGVVYVSAPSIGRDGVVKLPPFSYALEKYDRNKDGKLSLDEAPADDLFFMKRSGVPDNIAGAHFTIKSMFRNVDANKDGFVDESEYNAIGERFASSRGDATGILAIRPTRLGALDASALQWVELRGAAEVTTPLEYRGRVYVANNGGIISCMDAKKGSVIYRGRVNAPGMYFASPVAAGGKVFVASAEGVVTVLGGGETLEILANNDLGEPVYGTPAIVGSTIYIRSSAHLWAFVSK